MARPKAHFKAVPSFARRAEDYPERATTLEQAQLPFYCINCYRKASTAYVTPNLGPFCAECLTELVACRK